MTENMGFSVSNMKDKCRACLQVAEKVYPMTAMEINAYQNLIEKMTTNGDDMNLCLLCRWMLKKCMKFSQQCLNANKLLNQAAGGVIKSTLIHQQTSMYDLKRCNLEVHYFCPVTITDSNGEEKEELMPLDDAVQEDDDDEIPLVMLQGEHKNNKEESDSFEITQEIEIKEEPGIKEEFNEDLCPKVRSKKKKKINVKKKEGFSSRMVQETDEYVVIKLTKKEVLAELAERAKAESYIRSPYKCKKCVKGFNFEEVLTAHMVKHTREHGTYECEMCTQYCPSPVSLRGHIKSHTTRYKCKVCGHVRLSRQHLLEHHAINHTQGATTYTCDKCLFSTNKRTIIQRHVKTHVVSARHTCHRCGKLFNTIESLRVHTTYKCKVCGHVRLSRQHLLEHHAINHTQGATTYTCDKCLFSTNKRTIIQRHVKTHVVSARHTCHRCGKLFNTIESLRVHTTRHDKSKRFQCSQCDKQFIYPSLLHKHVQAVHERKEYYCVECDVRFKSAESLRLHFKKAKRHRDSSSYKYECPQCPQRFISTSSLSVHLTCSHDAPKQHACDICHRQYSNREALRAHTWRVHHADTTPVLLS